MPDCKKREMKVVSFDGDGYLELKSQVRPFTDDYEFLKGPCALLVISA